MNPEPPRQLRWLLACAATALVSVLAALVALEPAEASPDWLQFLGRFHPLCVHLPIGVVLLVTAAEVASAKATVRARLDPVILPVLVILVATALPAFVLGLMLAHGGGYPEALLVPHRRFASIGLVLSCVSLAAWSMYVHRSSSRWRNGYRAALGASLVTLGVGAHFGGSMTHGDTYLVRYAPQPIARWFGVEPPKVVVPTSAPNEEPSVYASVVQPVLTQYCVNCHGPDKAKGDLRLDGYAELMKGGDSGPAIVARAPDKSRLVTLLRLPEADVDHMPPQGKPQPSQAQIELISWWILRGASEHERVREVLPPAEVLELLKAAERTGKPKPVPSITQKSADAPADPAASEPEPESEPDGERADEAASAVAPVASGARGLVYQDLVAPLLAARCSKCHGPAKQKGRLRVDSPAALAKGGKEGPAVIPGNPGGSPLVARLRLPLADDAHMPPEDEPQLTAAQIRLLEWWIQEGADPSEPRDRLPESLAALSPPVAAPSVAASEAAGGDTPGSTPETSPAETPAAPPEPSAAAIEPGAFAPAPPEVLAALPPEVELFTDLILPVLREDCGDCHLGEPLMGDLSVASFDDLVRGGVVVPGDPAGSELYRRVTLPASDDDRMPPPGEEPLSALEIAALRFWISEGAEADETWAPEQLPAEVARAVRGRLRAPDTAPAFVAEEPAPGRVAPERATAGGCGTCAVGTELGSDPPALAVLGLLGWSGAWHRRTRRRQEPRRRWR